MMIVNKSRDCYLLAVINNRTFLFIFQQWMYLHLFWTISLLRRVLLFTHKSTYFRSALLELLWSKMALCVTTPGTQTWLLFSLFWHRRTELVTHKHAVVAEYLMCLQCSQGLVLAQKPRPALPDQANLQTVCVPPTPYLSDIHSVPGAWPLKIQSDGHTQIIRHN